jgi:hypothetical protein
MMDLLMESINIRIISKMQVRKLVGGVSLIKLSIVMRG